MQVMHDPGTDTPMGPAKLRASTPAELAEIVAAVDRGLRRGAIAVGMLIELAANSVMSASLAGFSWMVVPSSRMSP